MPTTEQCQPFRGLGNSSSRLMRCFPYSISSDSGIALSSRQVQAWADATDTQKQVRETLGVSAVLAPIHDGSVSQIATQIQHNLIGIVPDDSRLSSNRRICRPRQVSQTRRSIGMISGGL